MGGYAFDASVKPKFLPGSCTQAILTSKGVEWLMVHNSKLLPELSKEMIMDKSKADGLAKLILLVQSCWFCVNCLTRIAQRLPLSLLETTFAHALCTLITYLLWWYKPLNIFQSTLIFGENARETYALMWTISPSKLYCFAGMLQSKGASEPSSLASSALLVQDFIRTEPNSVTRLQRILETASKAWHDPRWNVCSDTSLSSQTTIERWKLASQALSDYDSEHWYSWGQLVTPRAELRGDLHAQDIFSTQAVAAVAVLTAVYGAPHLAVWDAEFPTHLEQALWR